MAVKVKLYKLLDNKNQQIYKVQNQLQQLAFNNQVTHQNQYHQPSLKPHSFKSYSTIHRQSHHLYKQMQSPRVLSYSMISSSPSNITVQQHKLPAISQPLISRYRIERLPINHFTVNKSLLPINFFTQLLCGKQSDASQSMCTKCQRSKQMDLCSFILQMIEQKYNWKQDVKFRSSYQFYNRKKIALFLTDQDIQYRLMSKFSILGVVLLDNHKLLLMRIIKNYIKHTVYYGEEHKLTTENDYYFWFLIGVPKYLNDLQSLPKDSVGLHEPIMFWALDMVMNKLNNCTQAKIKAISQLTLQYCQFFYQRQCKCLEQASYDIDLAELMYQWTNQGMMGYMGIEFIGFYIKSILKEGYEYVQKTIMSYFEKRVVKLDKDQVISFQNVGQGSGSSNNRSSNNLFVNNNNSNNSNNCNNAPYNQFHGFSGGIAVTVNQQTKRAKKQQILKVLLDSNQQWPGIFFSTNVYDLKK